MKIVSIAMPGVSEESIQRALADYLPFALKPGVMWTHMPSGGMRDRVAGAKLKAMGHHAGWPDLQFVYAGTVMFLELKSGKGRISDTQLAVHQGLRNAGVTVRVAVGFEEAMATLDDWGLLKQPTRNFVPRQAKHQQRDAP